MIFTLQNRRWILSLLIALIISLASHSQSEYNNISKGSYVIDLGSDPQTVSNALKPYGLIYGLLKDQLAEIKWVINPEKEKDGIDFQIGDQSFRSGSFIIPVSYISDKTRERISKWEERGVIGTYLSEDISLPVFAVLSVAPKWTLDKENGDLVLAYFKAAGIPPEAHKGNNPKNWKNPEELGVCDDIFVMPHAEPEFETHKNLYTWNRRFKGAIWAGCRAPSELENIYGNMEFDGKWKLVQLNFLSAGAAGARTTGLVPFYEHRYATPPYTHQLPSDPVAQYIGRSDNALINGSERIYYPKKANDWRPGTKKIIIDKTTPDIPEISGGPGAILIYGHAYDDPDNGLVMYQVSHEFGGKDPANIAAVRAFFNWSFYATEVKRRENIVRFENTAGDKIFAARVGDDLSKMLNLDPILFDLDKAEIKPNAAVHLDEIATYMIQYPELLIDIRSHTDSRADDEYNLKLSRERVNVTRQYLIASGVDPARISGRGYGETELLNDCRNGVPCSESKHEINRRSEFILSINCDLYEGNLKL